MHHPTVIYEQERWTVVGEGTGRLCIRRHGVTKWVNEEDVR